jgi:glycosyltransferase involved in cell wall biosynthesis
MSDMKVVAEPQEVFINPPLAVDSEAPMRLSAQGKFLFLGDEKLYVRGVTYGTFRPDDEGNEFPGAERVEADFAQMAANGINAVRTYTVPPRWLLDLAQEYGLRLMVGLAAERYVGYLTDRKGAPDITDIIRRGVSACAGHPAVLCYAVGNEIPASVVRWLGAVRVSRFLERLCRAVESEDRGSLVTYVNYPSTEYLDLPFLDLVCFNVYLESPERLAAYLARLQNIADDRPLLMGELGLDSLRHGEITQACALDAQVRTAFQAGCAGAFVYAWTDEWFRGGEEVHDWAFGLTTRHRHPKASLTAVRQAFRDVPFRRTSSWPRVSVVVCSHNGSRTIRECLERLQELDYPDFEVIVVDDGSTDGTGAIVREYGVRVIATDNQGLSNARNMGLSAATGEFIAYIDDDAYPDRHWLSYLAEAFRRSAHAAIGGPNYPPPGDGPVAECVAHAPGGPVHVLFSDREAEHIPGCNMAFRTSVLRGVGGFDSQFRVAGDDVDVCWRLHEKGLTIGYCAAAVVWHHRRNSIRAFLKQQKGYGKAEALLAQKWPEKYSRAGYIKWAGRVYSLGDGSGIGWHRRIYQGIWGSAPFQRVYEAGHDEISWLPQTPEWYLLVSGFAVLSLLGILWKPLLAAFPLCVIAALLPLPSLVRAARRVHFAGGRRFGLSLWMKRGLTAFLCAMQPLARLWGRVRNGLLLGRQFRGCGLAWPGNRRFGIWTEHWQAPDARLCAIENQLREERIVVVRGGDFDFWDLEIEGGLLGGTRLLLGVEEHGFGRQMVRVRCWPKVNRVALGLGLLGLALSIWAAWERSWLASGALGVMGFVVLFRIFEECGRTMAAACRALKRANPDDFRK